MELHTDKKEREGRRVFTITENLAEPVETFLERWFTTESFRVTVVEVVRSLEDVPRQDVAYVLREQRPRSGPSVDGAKEVLIVFLKDYDYRRLECHVYHEWEMPLAFDCPRSILERLSPATNQAALAWRKQCWQRQHHPLSGGGTIAFDVDIPVPFIPAGIPVTVEWDGSAPVFTDKQGQRYRVPLWRMYPYSILPTQPAEEQ